MTESTTLREQAEEDENSDDIPAPLTLSVVHSSGSTEVGLSVPLRPQSSVVIGRRPGLDLSVADKRVSRTHVRLVWDARCKVYRYADLSTANGTFVNGQRSSAGILNRNDVIRIGDTLLVCQATDTQPSDDDVVRAAKSDLPILVTGETGSGKELLAKRLHDVSGRVGDFVPVNCAVLPRELAAAELFGHTRSAFSGARAARNGLMRAAVGGTLFLDEVAELPKEVQASLLRSLQEHRVRPIGSDQEVEVNFRVVAATNADLNHMVAAGAFREDLLARLAHLVFRVAPLRERRAEILTLLKLFAPGLELNSSAAELLLLFDWPRNVRQLRAFAESISVLRPNQKRLQASDLHEYLPVASEDRSHASIPQVNAKGQGEFVTKLTSLLQQHAGNVSKVAVELGKPRSHVYRWMRAFRLSRDQFTP